MIEKIYRRQLQFSSEEHTSITDITGEINDAIKKANIENGLAIINTLHTTLGTGITELDEPKLIDDIINHFLTSIPEDERSEYQLSDVAPVKYGHRCQDNPRCDEVDIGYNAASHLRSLLFKKTDVRIIREGRIELGKYEQVGVFEFDGRNGSGVNPIRQRIVQIYLIPMGRIVEI